MLVSFLTYQNSNLNFCVKMLLNSSNYFKGQFPNAMQMTYIHHKSYSKAKILARKDNLVAAGCSVLARQVYGAVTRRLAPR